MPLPVISDAPHVIQLSVAPAFVLAAIGATLTVLTNRLARVDDHAEKRPRSTGGSRPEADVRDRLLSVITLREYSALALSVGL